jgi:thioredoxin reductase (NADPH)
MFVVLKGTVVISQRDGLGHVVPIASQGPGHFLAEVSQLSGRHALVDGYAEEDVETLLVPPEQLRALIIAEADLGERIVRALILRRVGLIEADASGPVLIVSRSHPGAPPGNLPERNGYPHVVDANTMKRLRQCSSNTARAGQVPAICPNGTRARPVRRPGAQLGMLDAARDELRCRGRRRTGGSGHRRLRRIGRLRVVVLAARSGTGRRARASKASAPTGISGRLAGRAFVQAQKFGAEILIPAQAAALNCARGVDGELTLTLTDGRKFRSRTIVIASGARYRRPDVPGLTEFEGRGVWYWASALEAKMYSQAEVALVGGGNSAGQAAVFLSGYASRVHMLVRGPGLAASMSRYLIDRIDATPNIELHPDTQLTRLHGDRPGGLAAVTWRNGQTGFEEQRPLRHVFLFVGADPETDWLEGCSVARDAHGFVLTGKACSNIAPGVTSLESNVPGVFAVGDVRSGSVKRVGAAIGEGAAVVALIHQYLAVAA